MGAIGLSLKLEPRPGAETGDLDELHAQISDAVWDFVGRYTSGAACDKIYDGYISEARHDERYLSRHELDLSFMFPDYAGCCNRSCELAYHWFRLALACSRDQVDELVSDCGYVVSGERESVRDVLAGETRVRFLETRGQLYMVYGDLESYDISGDDETLEPTDEERAEAERMIREGDTDDPMTRMLAPHADFIAGVLETLDADNPEIVASIMWYLGNTAAPGDDALGAIFEVAGRGGEVAESARRALCRLARHADVAAAVRDRLADDNPGIRAAALAAIPPLRERELLETPEAIDALLDGLGAGSPAVDVAAENLGYVDLEGYRNRVVRELLGLLEGGCPPEAAHGAVLSLVNLHLKKREAPEEVMAAFRREAESGAGHAPLAQWALQMFAPAGG